MTLTKAAMIHGEAQADQAPSEPAPNAQALRLRAVHRAAADLRRGTPVLLDGPDPLVMVAAETAGAGGLAEFTRLAAGPAILLLAPVRAAAVLRRPVAPSPAAVALQVSAALFDPGALRSLADPTVEQILPEHPEPAGAPPPQAPAALALAKLARLLPAVLAAPARPDARDAARRASLLSVPAGDVLDYPVALAANLIRVADAAVPLAGAEHSRIVAFRGPDTGIEHLAIVIGDPAQAAAPLVRMHSECFTGDLLGSLRCDCGPQLRGAIDRIAAEGAGVLLYLAQEGRGIGLVNKLRAYALQDRGLDTLDANRALGWGADERNFMIAATMLTELGIGAVRLLTNNPHKLEALAACGIRVVGREAHRFSPNGINDRYLATKVERFGHLPG
jgi:GTP cyclohydrolase II